MQKKFLFLSFIEGAAVMAAELCGARLLAPVFGSSLYVWASVMGITLAALAGGYFYGGWLSEKNSNGKHLYRIMLVASLLIVVMPVISVYILPYISYLPFLMSVVIGTVLLLFFPVFLLGAASPLFVALQTSQNQSPGKVSGMVYAISTAGGIAATFLSGFLLIPSLGLTISLIIFGSLLFISTFIVFRNIKFASAIFFVAFVLMDVRLLANEGQQILRSEGIMGSLEVLKENRNGKEILLLKVNSIVQSEMDMQSKASVSEYVRLLDNMIHKADEPRNALVLGLGGGLTSDLLVRKNYRVTGVEFDQRIINAAQRYFFLDNSVECMCEDARYYINHCDKKFSLVLFDVFKAEEQPDHVLTIESLERLKENLDPNATIYVNWHGYVSGNEGRGTSVLYNTLVKAGFKVMVNSFSDDEAHRNIVFLASLSNDPDFLVKENSNVASQDAFHSYPVVINRKKDSEVNTDDRPVLERYNAPANKAWRSNYLRYYQSAK
jgi:predicted membrane-bound spermidine synthase